MSLQQTFHYFEVGEPLLEHLNICVGRLDSFALLGPQAVGKRHVVLLLRDRLVEAGHTCLLVEFSGPDLLTRESEVVDRLAGRARPPAHVRERTPSIENDYFASEHSIHDFCAALKRWRKEHDKPVHLFLANVDAISEPLARKLLDSVQRLVNDRAIVAGLSGESNLRHLVYGPTSPFRCADNYVLQGYDRTYFDRFVDLRVEALNLEFDDLARAKEILFKRTGGQAQQVRAVLFCLSENRVRYGGAKKPWQIQAAHLPDDLMELYGIPLYGVVPFRTAVRGVEVDAQSLEHMRTLIEAGEFPVTSREPTTVELLGLGRRKDGIIRWGSEYAAAFCRRYYSPRRLGDLCAVEGNLEAAAKHYHREANEADRARPCSAADGRECRAVISAIAGTMHRRAMDGKTTITELFSLLRLAVCDVLGFAEILLANYDRWWVKVLSNASEGNAADLKSVLPAPTSPSANFLDDAGTLGTFRLVMPRADSTGSWGIVVRATNPAEPVPRSRHKLMLEVLGEFKSAVQHMDARAHAAEQLDRRNLVLEAIAGLQGLSFDPAINELGLLDRAASHFQQFNFGRVIFLLKLPAGDALNVVHEVPPSLLP